MSTLPFKENKEIQLGVEIEIQLIDPTTGDLKPTGAEILQSIKNTHGTPRIKSELFQSMLEIDTPISKNAMDAAHSLRDSLSLVRATAAKYDTQIIMAGTHPFAHYTEGELTPHTRYYQLVDRNQWITRRLQIFGLHVHLGMRNGDHAMAMNNALCHYLPIILALSASSPYWQSQDTGLASSRITFFESMPTGGPPYLLNTWSEFEALIQRLMFSKSITSLKDLWWDIRPNIEYGTIEIRIADCPPTITEVEALVALIHSLAVFIDAELQSGQLFSPPPEWILRENKWRASRYGIQCELIQDISGRTSSFLASWQTLRETLKSTSARLGYDPLFDFLSQLIHRGPSYLRQRRQGPELQNVIQHLIWENKNDRPQWD
ncbi:MAG: YbdK family carboxylate-amine ligase [Bdellovibrionaceae bacterium]|nr:YbdK family carboxylate-amine ligase [Pseudobdellovibrionaceae bacterium]